MRSTVLLSLAAWSHAFVLPQQQVFEEVQVEPHHRDVSLYNDLPSTSELVEDVKETVSHLAHDLDWAFDKYSTKAHSALDDAVSYATDATETFRNNLEGGLEGFDTEAWLNQASEEVKDATDLDIFKKKHHKCPEHGHKPNETVYEIIAKSKYTTKLAKLINKFPDVKDALNGTKANYTVFAPTDKAFEKLAKLHPKLDEEQLLEVLSYHVSSDFYPLGRILASKTIPTALNSSELGPTPLPQRLSTNIGLFSGVTVNFYSKVVAVNIFGTNGVIHGVNSVIAPPPRAVEIIDLLPAEFSTLELALLKTGLLEKIKETKHQGGTLFAPGNPAFAKLGSRANTFLFSKYGLKYLKALLKYHVVPGATLYSDAFYDANGESRELDLTAVEDNEEARSIPKGTFQVTLPTLLKDRALDINIARFGRLIDIRINGFYNVAVPDAPAKDGVVHGMGSVLIPPKKLANGELDVWVGDSEISVEELTERLEDFVEAEEVEEQASEWFDL